MLSGNHASDRGSFYLSIMRCPGHLETLAMPNRRDYQRDYARSEHGKQRRAAAAKKYFQTDKGREANRRAQQAWRDRQKEKGE